MDFLGNISSPVKKLNISPKRTVMELLFCIKDKTTGAK